MKQVITLTLFTVIFLFASVADSKDIDTTIKTLGLKITQGATNTNGRIEFSDIQDTSYGAGIAHNAYFDGINWRYRNDGYARISFFKDNNGFYNEYYAPSGLADGIITLDTTKALFVDSGGHLGIGLAQSGARIAAAGTGTTSFITERFSNTSGGPWFFVQKSRGATVGSQVIVQDGDELGGMYGDGSDGVSEKTCRSNWI